MIFTTKIILLSLTASSLGLAGYKYFQYWTKEKEYEELYKIFEDYDKEKVVYELEEERILANISNRRLEDEYAPFRVVYFESISEMDLP
jgi:flagellar biosynthesis/type III secretory pathway M-ring protein FliF/YscJ